MQYAPTITEIQAIQQLTVTERFEYTTPRFIESEEVWSIGNEEGWLIDEKDGDAIITLWPYRQLAAEYAQERQPDSGPQSVSLEHFLYTVLKQCSTHDIKLEILPSIKQRGSVIAADRLYEILEGMVDTGGYFIEG